MASIPQHHCLDRYLLDLRQEHLAQMQWRPSIFRRLSQQNWTDIEILRLNRGLVRRVCRQKPHRLPRASGRRIRQHDLQSFRVIDQRRHLTRQPHRDRKLLGERIVAQTRHREADAAHEEVPRRFVGDLLDSLVEEGHADDAADFLIERRNVVGQHAAGGETIEHDGPRVMLKFEVDEVASDLDPVVV